MPTLTRNEERTLVVILAAVFVLSSTVVVASLLHIRRTGLTVSDLTNGAVLSTEALDRIRITATNPATLDSVEVLVDGVRVGTDRSGDRLTLARIFLPEGRHTLLARARTTSLLMPNVQVIREFTVDGTPPSLAVDGIEAETPHTPVTIRGKANGASLVRVGEHQARIVGDTFEATLPSPPATVFIEARDVAGNTQWQHLPVRVPHPGMRAVHMSAATWTQLRESVFTLARKGFIDTVQLDVKNENGEIGYASQVPLAAQIGAVRHHYDPRQAIDELHQAGLRAVGRIAAFRDPTLARACWNEGLRDHVAPGNLTNTNPAHPEVRAYNVALAREAASLGFDDVLLDHISTSFVDFLAEAREAVRAHGTYLGAVVRGGDIPTIAAEVDYLVNR